MIKYYNPNSIGDIILSGGTEQRNLPEGYTQVEYIESTGTQYLISPYIVNNKTKFYCRYMQTERGGEAAAQIIFGVTDNPTPNIAYKGICRLLAGTTYFNRVAWGNTESGSVIDISGYDSLNTWYELYYDQNKLNINNTLVATSSTPLNSIWSANYGLGIFARNGASVTMKSKAKISSIWAKEDDVYKLNLIPCRRNSDNALGMYDTVTGNFLTNQGTDTFIAGADVTKPSPEIPMDIWCNNGVLKARHQSGLPFGYTLLNYIESTGTQYIDTGVFGTDKTSVNIKYIVTEMSTTAGFGIIGYQKGFKLSPSFQRVLWTNINNNQFRYGNTLTDTFNKVNVNEVIEESFGNGSWIFNGENIPLEVIDSFTTSPNTMILFGLNNQGTVISLARIKLYFCSIEKNGTLVANYIPCRRNSDNVVGVYDTVSGQFLTNAGTGDFIAGNPVNDPVEIYTDGTQEKVEVIGKNLVNPNAIIVNKYISYTGEEASDDSFAISDYIYVAGVSKITISTIDAISYPFGGAACKAFYDANKNYISNTATSNSQIKSTNPETVIVPSNAVYFRTSVRKSGASRAQIEYGDTATTFEPYYNGGTAIAEMLLKVGNYQDIQSILDGIVTRNVGIKVLDGSENIYNGADSAGYWGIASSYFPNIKMQTSGALLTTHWKEGPYISPTGAYCSIAGTTYFAFNKASLPNASTAEAVKQWLADQYNAGTSVIVVYPLATPTTEKVASQFLNGINVTQTAGSIQNLPIDISYLHSLKKCYVTDNSGTLQEVNKIYIGNTNIY